QGLKPGSNTADDEKVDGLIGSIGGYNICTSPRSYHDAAEGAIAPKKLGQASSSL
ncbi:hypothetical protein BgiBS90_021689, partial [Biomphalaria glabrata]